MKRLLFILFLIPNLAFAQISQQTITNDITNNLPTNNINEISAQLLRNTLNAMTSAIFQSQGISGLTITGTPTVGQIPVATGSTTAVWGNLPNGVSCSGTPSSSFSATNGIVTHC
jgi:hypothetical protein